MATAAAPTRGAVAVRRRARSPQSPPARATAVPAALDAARTMPAPPAAGGRADVYELAARWRRALDAADSALAAGSESLPAAEVSSRRQRLGAERAATLRLLTATAREAGVSTRFLHLLPRRDLRRLLELPADVLACVFELEGVLVAGAELHLAAWERTFDELLAALPDAARRQVAPFHAGSDYARHVHGRPRLEGVAAFLASRGISLPYGAPDDPPGTASVCGVGNRKNELLIHLLATHGIHSYDDSRRYLETVKEAELESAVVSASANTGRILEEAGMSSLVDVSVDGRAMVEERLGGWPAPDVLLAACRRLGVEPQRAAAFETSAEGVAAARAAGMAVVVGIDRAGAAAALRSAGADLVVPELGELLGRRLQREAAAA